MEDVHLFVDYLPSLDETAEEVGDVVELVLDVAVFYVLGGEALLEGLLAGEVGLKDGWKGDGLHSGE